MPDIQVIVPIMEAPHTQFEDYIMKSQRDALYVTRERVFDECRELIPLGRTGRLRASLDVDVMGDGLIISIRAPYASIVEEGAYPHPITPTKAKALRFWMGRVPVFAKRVVHPGQAPQEFVEPIRRRAREILREELIRALEKNKRMVER